MIIYSLKVAIALTLFYLLFKWIMSRDTLHSINRKLILTMIGTAFIAPLLKIPTLWSSWSISSKSGDIIPTLFSTLHPTSSLEQMQEVFSTSSIDENNYQYSSILMIGITFIYFCGLFIKLYSTLRGLQAIHKAFKHGERKEYNGYSIVVTPDIISPFSWWNTIVLSKVDYNKHSEMILAHEYTHIIHHHSFDILFCEAMIALQWFNPIAYFLKWELQAIHEYEADESVIKNGFSSDQYQLLLIEKAIGTHSYTMLANNFNHSSLKKRITMMLRKKSSKWAGLKSLGFIPVGAITIALFAQTETATAEIEQELQTAVILSDSILKKIEMPLPIKDSAQQKTRKTGEIPPPPPLFHTMNTVDKQPMFPGGDRALMEYLTNQVIYPDSAKSASIEGKVTVEFFINESGKMTDIHLLKSINPLLDKESLRVVNKLAKEFKWIPGEVKGKKVRVFHQLPISFKLPK